MLCASPFGGAAQQDQHLRADEYPQGAGRICNAPSSRTAALGIGPYKLYRRFFDFHTPQVQSKALADRRGVGKPYGRFPHALFSFGGSTPFPFLKEKRKWGRKFPFSEKGKNGERFNIAPVSSSQRREIFCQKKARGRRRIGYTSSPQQRTPSNR